MLKIKKAVMKKLALALVVCLAITQSNYSVKAEENIYPGYELEEIEQTEIEQTEIELEEIEQTESEQTESEPEEIEQTEGEPEEIEQTESEQTEGEPEEIEQTEGEPEEIEQTEGEQTEEESIEDQEESEENQNDYELSDTPLLIESEGFAVAVTVTADSGVLPEGTSISVTESQVAAGDKLLEIKSEQELAETAGEVNESAVVLMLESEENSLYSQKKDESAEVAAETVITSQILKDITSIEDVPYGATVALPLDIDLHITDDDGQEVEVQPQGMVSVSVEIPESMSKEYMAVYHVAEDGSLERMPGYVDGDSYVFMTDHFSTYTLVSTSFTVLEAGASGKTLSTGYYMVKSNVVLTYTNSLNISGTVYVYLQSGAQIKATGKAGSGSTGGTAGIYLPGGSTLYLCGKGTVTAKGGNAGSGSSGSVNGKDAWLSKGGNKCHTGSGGSGGSGGGGAGAGIGGNGGTGGSGGSGASGFEAQTDDGYQRNGSDGSKGGNGGSGSGMGTLYVLDTVQVSAAGGSNGNAGGTVARGLTRVNVSSGGSGNFADDKGSGWKNDYEAGAGGTGGGGGAGFYAANIGGGGAGAGGGGGAGSGGASRNGGLNSNSGYADGQGGFGGSGSSNGASGSLSNPSTNGEDKTRGGYGGSSGSAGSGGAGGRVYVEASARISAVGGSSGGYGRGAAVGSLASEDITVVLTGNQTSRRVSVSISDKTLTSVAEAVTAGESIVIASNNLVTYTQYYLWVDGVYTGYKFDYTPTSRKKNITLYNVKLSGKNLAYYNLMSREEVAPDASLDNYFAAGYTVNVKANSGSYSWVAFFDQLDEAYSNSGTFDGASGCWIYSFSMASRNYDLCGTAIGGSKVYDAASFTMAKFNEPYTYKVTTKVDNSPSDIDKVITLRDEEGGIAYSLSKTDEVGVYTASLPYDEATTYKLYADEEYTGTTLCVNTARVGLEGTSGGASTVIIDTINYYNVTEVLLLDNSAYTNSGITKELRSTEEDKTYSLKEEDGIFNALILSVASEGATNSYALYENGKKTTRTITVAGSASNHTDNYYTVSYDKGELPEGHAPAELLGEAPASYVVISGTEITVDGYGSLDAGAKLDSGCSFKVWEAALGNTSYKMGDPVEVTGTTSFTAIWTENSKAEAKWEIPYWEGTNRKTDVFYGSLAEAIDTMNAVKGSISVTVQNSVELPYDLDVKEGRTFTVDTGITLTIPEGRTVTNAGIIVLADSAELKAASLDNYLVNTGNINLKDSSSLEVSIENQGRIVSVATPDKSATIAAGTTILGGTVSGKLINDGYLSCIDILAASYDDASDSNIETYLVNNGTIAGSEGESSDIVEYKLFGTVENHGEVKYYTVMSGAVLDNYDGAFVTKLGAKSITQEAQTINGNTYESGIIRVPGSGTVSGEGEVSASNLPNNAIKLDDFVSGGTTEAAFKNAFSGAASFTIVKNTDTNQVECSIILDADIVVKTPIVIKGSDTTTVSINLNGHKLIAGDGVEAAVIILGGNASVDDTSAPVMGGIEPSTAGGISLQAAGGAKLELITQVGAVKADESVSITADGEAEELTVTGGAKIQYSIKTKLTNVKLLLVSGDGIFTDVPKTYDSDVNELKFKVSVDSSILYYATPASVTIQIGNKKYEAGDGDTATSDDDAVSVSYSAATGEIEIKLGETKGNIIINAAASVNLDSEDGIVSFLPATDKEFFEVLSEWSGGTDGTLEEVTEGLKVAINVPESCTYPDNLLKVEDDIIVRNNVIIVVGSGTGIEISPGSSILVDGVVRGEGTIVNKGELVVGKEGLVSSAIANEGTITNEGGLIANGGSISGGKINGGINIGAAGAVSEAAITGPVVVTGGTLSDNTILGDVTLSGNSEVKNNTIEGNVSVAEGTTLTGGSIDGAVTNSGTITGTKITGKLTNSASGRITLCNESVIERGENTGTLIIPSGTRVYIREPFENKGQIIVEGELVILSDDPDKESTCFKNTASGTIEVKPAGTLTVDKARLSNENEIILNGKLKGSNGGSVDNEATKGKIIENDDSTPSVPAVIENITIKGGSVEGSIQNKGRLEAITIKGTDTIITGVGTIAGETSLQTGACIKDQNIEGTLNNNGTVEGGTVSEAAVVKGGTLEGTIENNGTVEATTISSGATLKGGAVAGDTKNHGKMLNQELIDGTLLNDGEIETEASYSTEIRGTLYNGDTDSDGIGGRIMNHGAMTVLTSATVHNGIVSGSSIVVTGSGIVVNDGQLTIAGTLNNGIGGEEDGSGTVENTGDIVITSKGTINSGAGTKESPLTPGATGVIHNGTADKGGSIVIEDGESGHGTINIGSTGTLRNDGSSKDGSYILLGEKGIIHNDGGYLATNGYGLIAYSQESQFDNNMPGASLGKVVMSTVYSEGELKAALASDLKTIVLRGNVTLTDDFEIPEGVKLIIETEGVDNEGNLISGGELNTNGHKLIVNGELVVKGKISGNVEVNSEITVADDGILTGNITNNGIINNDGVIHGITNNGTINNDGVIYGTIDNHNVINSSSSGRLGDGSTTTAIMNSGTINGGTIQKKTTLEGGTLKGDIVNEGTISKISSVDAIIANRGVLNLSDATVTSQGSISTGKPGSVIVDSGTKATIDKGAELTFEEDSTLDNKGTIELKGVIRIGEGGSLVNDGTIKGDGTLYNKGKIINTNGTLGQPYSDFEEDETPYVLLIENDGGVIDGGTLERTTRVRDGEITGKMTVKGKLEGVDNKLLDDEVTLTGNGEYGIFSYVEFEAEANTSYYVKNETTGEYIVLGYPSDVVGYDVPSETEGTTVTVENLDELKSALASAAVAAVYVRGDINLDADIIIPVGKSLVIACETVDYIDALTEDEVVVIASFGAIRTGTHTLTNNGTLILQSSSVTYSPVSRNEDGTVILDEEGEATTHEETDTKTDMLQGKLINNGTFVIDSGADAKVDIVNNGKFHNDSTENIVGNVINSGLYTGNKVTGTVTNEKTGRLVGVTADTDNKTDAALTLWYEDTSELKSRYVSEASDGVLYLGQEDSGHKVMVSGLPKGTYKVYSVREFEDTAEQTFKAEFYNMGHGVKPATQYGILENGSVTNPGNLSASGYVFDGWYTSGTYVSKWDFAADMVTSNLKLFAKWSAVSGGGSSSGGYGGGAGGAGAGGTGESYTINVTGEGSIQVKTVISEGMAEVSDVTMEKMESVVSSGIDTITVDLSGAKQKVKGVILTKQTIETLADVIGQSTNGVEYVDIYLTDATVTINKQVLDTLEDSTGETISLVVEVSEDVTLSKKQEETIKKMNVYSVFEAFFESNGVRIHDFNGGKAIVKMKFTPKKGTDVKNYFIYYIDKDGNTEFYPTRYKDGKLEFTTGHFSEYVIVYDETMTNDTEENKPEEDTTEEDKTTGDTSGTSKVVTSDFGTLKARSTKQTETSITLDWNKVENADGYIIYGAKCNANGQTYTIKKLKTITSNDTLSWTQSKLDKAAYYKYYVVAYKTVNGKKVTIAKSVFIHATTKGGKYGVASSVKVTAIGDTVITSQSIKYEMKLGDAERIAAKEINADLPIKDHRGLVYESSNNRVVKVTADGEMIAVGTGKCNVWVYAQNGVYRTIKVTVSKASGTVDTSKINLGTRFDMLMAQSMKQTKTSITINWNMIPEADGYLIYGALCNSDGEVYAMEKLTTIKDNNVTSWTHKKLESGKYYKYYVKAYINIGGKKVTRAKSVTIHVSTLGGGFGVASNVNAQIVGLVPNDSELYTVKIGKEYNITAAEESELQVKKHRGLKYESGNENVAIVTASGKIKPIGEGTCEIYVYSQNGIYTTLKLKVK